MLDIGENYIYITYMKKQTTLNIYLQNINSLLNFLFVYIGEMLIVEPYSRTYSAQSVLRTHFIEIFLYHIYISNIIIVNVEVVTE